MEALKRWHAKPWKKDLTINDLLIVTIAATLAVVNWGLINPFAWQLMIEQNGAL